MADSTHPVRPEDFLAALKGYTPERKLLGEKGVIANHYRILNNQPIAELSSSYASAYAVRDERTPEASLYALVFENNVPRRLKNIQVLKTFRHPSLISVLADGVTEVGADIRYAVILERPSGKLLSEALAQRRESVAESQILNFYLRPLIEIISAFVKLGISHNRINPANIYLSGNKIVLGECISEPSGFSQGFLYEPMDRMLTLPRAKADYAPSADCYALGIITLQLALGFNPYANSNKDALVHDILSSGAYHTLILPWDLPAVLQDMFRGLFGEGQRERWQITTLESWLGGRRFNLVMPTSPRDAARGFEFADKTYFTRRSLAHALSQHWKKGKEVLADGSLVRWLKTNNGTLEVGDAVARLMVAGRERTAQQMDELLARIIILLHPAGPIRFKQISTSADGVGALLANAMLNGQANDIRTLKQILDSDLISFWIEKHKTIADYTSLIAKLQKANQHSLMNGLGFGMERCLYDLNATLPCLSPLVNKLHVTTLSETLIALDTIAREKAASENVCDAHTAAFIANRLELNREIKPQDLNMTSRLAPDSPLIMLKLLAQAQNKSRESSLRGLSNWLALKLLPLLDDIHSRTRANKIRAELQTVANHGSIEALAALLLDSRVFEMDNRDFQRAAADYAAYQQQMNTLKGNAGFSQYAGVKGRGVAQTLAYGICIATLYATLKSYFNI